MTNTNLLKAKMVEKGYKQKEVAEILGISLGTLNAKINNKRSFVANEIQALCYLLDIVEKDPIFFMTNN